VRLSGSPLTFLNSSFAPLLYLDLKAEDKTKKKEAGSSRAAKALAAQDAAAAVAAEAAADAARPPTLSELDL